MEIKRTLYDHNPIYTYIRIDRNEHPSTILEKYYILFKSFLQETELGGYRNLSLMHSQEIFFEYIIEDTYC